MFDLITGEARHAPRHQIAPILASVAAHLAVIGSLLVATVAVVSDQLPEIPGMMAFVAAPPPPPPPLPPPPSAPPPARAPAPKPVPTGGIAAPVEAPTEIAPDAPPADAGEEGLPDAAEGVPGGVIGGVAGGLESQIPPPPPPPPPPAPRGPIRMGGQLQQPTLVHRVDPVYPGVAVSAGIEGTVILEAIVDEEGRVEDLKVLRSGGVLDRAALVAVRQWRYSPVLLNGRPEKFILTVVVSFRLSDVVR